MYGKSTRTRLHVVRKIIISKDCLDHRGARNLVFASNPLTMPVLIWLSLVAMTVSIENVLRPSVTLMVPRAELRLPEKGKTSGDLAH